MATVRIPTPLRPYTGEQEFVTVSGQTVGEALSSLADQYPDLRPHLFNEGKLRSFVNVFLGEEDVRYLDGTATSISDDSKLLIIPSIAGGAEKLRKVDHSALRTNQAFIIGLLIAAFILGETAWPVVAFVSAVMLIGTIIPEAGLFKRIYRHILQPAGLVKPDVITDNPEPHLFAQGLGGLFTLASTISLVLGAVIAGWVLTWIVIILAALNLFAGFCAGCFVYYQLNRLGVPGFGASPISKERTS